jgi:hypothetical protein
VPTATAIFVVETGLPRFDPARIDYALRQQFDTVDYLFMARRQDKLVTSIVAQNMKMFEKKWSTLNPRFELSRFPRLRDFAALDYAAQYTRWTRVIGPEHVIVVPYDEGDQGSFATIDRIFDFAGLGAAPRIDGIEGLRIHPTFSAFGMKKMAWLKSITRFAWAWPPFRSRLTAVWDSSSITTRRFRDCRIPTVKRFSRGRCLLAIGVGSHDASWPPTVSCGHCRRPTPTRGTNGSPE